MTPLPGSLSTVSNSINWNGDGDGRRASTCTTRHAWTSHGGKRDDWEGLVWAAAGSGAEGGGCGASCEAAGVGVADVDVDNWLGELGNE